MPKSILPIFQLLAIHTIKWYAHVIGNIKKNTILFTSNPDYSDNSRALSDFLSQQGYLKEYHIFWLSRDPQKCQKLCPFPEIKFLGLDETGFPLLKDLYTCITAEYSFYTHRPAIDRILAHPKQKIVQLWHGCSYKDKDAGIGRVPATFDYGLVSGPSFVDAKAYFFNAPRERMLPVGFPRYDWLLHPTTKAQTFANQLMGENTKLIIWMPTFRNDSKGRFNSLDGIASFPLMPTAQDWIQLDEVCRKNQVKLVIKLHMYQVSYDIDFSKLTNICILSNADFENNGVVMYEFLATTHALISDYSSVAVDYLVVDKPIAFALDDYKAYDDKRGFIFKEKTLDFMPGHHLFSATDLHEFIADVAQGKDPYFKTRHEMYGQTVTLSEHYCEDLVKALAL